MVESQGEIDLLSAENPDILGVILRLGRSFGPGYKDRRDRVNPGIAVRVGVGVELVFKVDLKRCLLFSLSDSGFFEGFAIIHEPAGQRPAVRGVLSLDENDSFFSVLLFDFNDDVHRRDGISVRRRRFFSHGPILAEKRGRFKKGDGPIFKKAKKGTVLFFGAAVSGSSPKKEGTVPFFTPIIPKKGDGPIFHHFL